MNNERKLTLIFLILGLVTGIASSYLTDMQEVGFGVALYLVSLLLVRQLLSLKEKISWILVNTAVTFGLVWLIVWVLLFSLR